MQFPPTWNCSWLIPQFTRYTFDDKSQKCIFNVKYFLLLVNGKYSEVTNNKNNNKKNCVFSYHKWKCGARYITVKPLSKDLKHDICVLDYLIWFQINLLHWIH